MKKKVLFWITIALVAFTSCNSNDDLGDKSIRIPGVTFDGDEECCLPEEALLVYNFLKTLKPIPEFSLEVEGLYDVTAYSKSGSFHVGYNDIYFVATKKSTGNYVKELQVKNVTPLMTMDTGKMTMQHSTPVASSVVIADDKFSALKHGWISFLMSSTEKDFWELSFDVSVLGRKASLENTRFTVDALPSGQNWLKSFKVGEKTYYVSLVNPDSWQTGVNDIKAYVSEAGNPKTVPYPESTEKFTIEIDPRMPDMGNHTSPDNKALTRQTDGSYKGVINLTMTGLWRIHLTVKDANGNVVYGGKELGDDGLSNLFWDVTI